MKKINKKQDYLKKKALKKHMMKSFELQKLKIFKKSV